MTYAFLFPGQGSQKVGMLQDYFSAFDYVRDLFEQSDDILSQKLSDLILKGDSNELQLTQNAQPAILLCSFAISQVLKKELNIEAKCLAGHSLGEYSALLYSGAMSFSSALKIVRQRGLYMQNEVAVGLGTMAAILGGDAQLIESVCSQINKDGHCVQAANYNCPGQIVISGHTAAVAQACEELKAKGVKRCIPLNVSAPFHSSLLYKAGEKLQKDLQAIDWSKSLDMPYYANVDACKYITTDDIAQRLSQQVYSPVKWQQSLESMLNNDEANAYIEVGPGKVVCGHMKKINSNITVFATDKVESLKNIKI